jgi:hypothetical protein
MLKTVNLYPPGQLPAASMAIGSVVQVVSSTTSTRVESSSSTFADTGLTASITPTKATNKILVLVSQNGNFQNGSATTGMMFRLLRGATEINVLENIAAYSAGASGVGSVSTCHLDSPATTSATTYKVQFANRNNAGSVSVQFDNNSTSTITLMEIQT